MQQIEINQSELMILSGHIAKRKAAQGAWPDFFTHQGKTYKFLMWDYHKEIIIPNIKRDGLLLKILAPNKQTKDQWVFYYLDQS